MIFRESCLRYAKQTRLFNFACISVTQNILKYLKQSSPVWKQKKPNVNKFLNNPNTIVWNNVFENSAKKIRHLLIKENFGWNYVLTLAFVIVGLWARIKVWELSTSDSSLVATLSSDSFYFASRDVLSSLDVKKVVLQLAASVVWGLRGRNFKYISSG